MKPSELKVGDLVLLKNHNTTKSNPPYQPEPLIITQHKGSMITAERGQQQKITRNSSFFKKSPRAPTTAEMEPDHPDPTTSQNVPHNIPQPPQTPQPSPHIPSERFSTDNSATSTNIPLRRPQRIGHLPKKYEDFIMQ